MNTEQEIRDQFEELARSAPGAEGLAQWVVRRHRQRRNARWATASVGGIAAIALVWSVMATRQGPLPIVMAQPSATSESAPAELGDVPAGYAGQRLVVPSNGSCARPGSPRFAFDGLVAEIDAGGSPTFDEGDVANTLDLVKVSMRVNSWFVGGGPAEVVVVLPSPDGAGSGESRMLPYRVGTRLLVAGSGNRSDAVDWSAANGDLAIASSGCGVGTHFYSPALADAWLVAAQRDDWSGLYATPSASGG